MADRSIETRDLQLADLPNRDASREELEEFCLTIDGYEDGLVSYNELLRLAERLEQAGWEHASLDDLRRAAFIRQRELRATDAGDEPSTASMVDRIREILREIRSRLTN